MAQIAAPGWAFFCATNKRPAGLNKEKVSAILAQ